MPPTPATHHRLTAGEVEMAFSYCDLQGDGLVTAAGLRARLAPLLLGFTDKKEQAALVETLLGGKPALTLAELTAVLLAPLDGANAKPAAAAKTKIKDLVADAFALLAGPEDPGGLGPVAAARGLPASLGAGSRVRYGCFVPAFCRGWGRALPACTLG